MTTFSGVAFTADNAATRIKTLTTDVIVENSPAPTAGKILIATSDTEAAWFLPSFEGPPFGHSHVKAEITDFAHTHPTTDIIGYTTTAESLGTTGAAVNVGGAPQPLSGQVLTAGFDPTFATWVTPTAVPPTPNLQAVYDVSGATPSIDTGTKGLTITSDPATGLWTLLSNGTQSLVTVDPTVNAAVVNIEGCLHPADHEVHDLGTITANWNELHVCDVLSGGTPFRAKRMKTATGYVDTTAAADPEIGQVLTATSTTTAEWADPGTPGPHTHTTAQIDGLLADSSELNQLQDALPGVIVNNKAVIYSASGGILANGLNPDGNTLTIGNTTTEIDISQSGGNTTIKGGLKVESTTNLQLTNINSDNFTQSFFLPVTRGLPNQRLTSNGFGDTSWQTIPAASTEAESLGTTGLGVSIGGGPAPLGAGHVLITTNATTATWQVPQAEVLGTLGLGVTIGNAAQPFSGQVLTAQQNPQFAAWITPEAHTLQTINPAASVNVGQALQPTPGQVLTASPNPLFATWATPTTLTHSHLKSDISDFGHTHPTTQIDGLLADSSQLNQLKDALPGFIVNNKAVIYDNTGAINATQVKAPAVVATTLDKEVAGALAIGPATATSVEISKAGSHTLIKGTSGFQQQITIGAGINFYNLPTARGNIGTVLQSDGAAVVSWNQLTTIDILDVVATPEELNLLFGASQSSQNVDNAVIYGPAGLIQATTVSTTFVDAPGNLSIGSDGTGEVILAQPGTWTSIHGPCRLLSLPTFGSPGSDYVFPVVRGGPDQVLRTNNVGVVTWQTLPTETEVLGTTTTGVNVGASAAPLAGQVLTASANPEFATWVTPAAEAEILGTATTGVNVGAAVAPLAGQVLTASANTAFATWVTPTPVPASAFFPQLLLDVYLSRNPGTFLTLNPSTATPPNVVFNQVLTNVSSFYDNITGYWNPSALPSSAQFLHHISVTASNVAKDVFIDGLLGYGSENDVPAFGFVPYYHGTIGRQASLGPADVCVMKETIPHANTGSFDSLGYRVQLRSTDTSVDVFGHASDIRVHGANSTTSWKIYRLA